MKLAQRTALATCILTFILIGVGVLVRATGSGLGCPDWPTCHGAYVPPGHKAAIIESSHRYVATTVGLMVIATAALAWKFYRHVPFVVWLATVAVPLVGFQGILGAITVKKELPPEIVATHLLTAMLVLSVLIAVYVAMLFGDPEREEQVQRVLVPARRPLGHVALAGLLWMSVTLWVGGFMTEYGASTACTGWPACNGNLLPGADDQEIWHMAHRYLAAGLMFFVMAFFRRARDNRSKVSWANTLAVAMVAAYVLQVLVGALNVWYTFPDWLVVSHTVIATAVWVTLSTSVTLAYYTPRALERKSRARTAEVPA